MAPEIEIIVGDVNDVEARIYARCRIALTGDQPGLGDPTELRGTLHGPFCDGARTLPAEFAFRRAKSGDAALIEAVVPDPCVWTPELPHVYQIDVEARQGGRIVAEHHSRLGLKRSQPRRGGMAFPG
jgi:hypothetical protein